MGGSCLSTHKSTYKILSKYKMMIKIKSMEEDQTHLFNHRNQNLCKNLVLENNGILIKFQNTFRLITNNQEFQKIHTYKINFLIDFIKLDEHHFKIFTNNPSDQGLSQNNFWNIVESTKKVELKKDDIIKLGHLRFKIFEIAAQEPEELIKEISAEEKIQKNCRICFENSSTNLNPLICPCHCIGSVGYIHLNCLREWFQTSNNAVRGQHFLMVQLKKHNCQLCKQEIKQYIVHEGKTYQTYYSQKNLQKPFMKFHMFEKQSNQFKTLCIISFKSHKSAVIGRDLHCGFQIKDEYNLSKHHSMLFYQNDRIYIKDNQSKYGTLKLVKEPIILELKRGTGQIFQIKNFILQFNVDAINHRIREKQNIQNPITTNLTNQEIISIIKKHVKIQNECHKKQLRLKYND